MGQIFDNGALFITDTTPRGAANWDPKYTINSLARDGLLNEYWGENAERKYFSIFENVLLDIFSNKGASEENNDIKKIMLQVENMTDPKSLNIIWKTHDPAYIRQNPSYDYFIVSKSYFSNYHQADIPDGILLGKADIIVASLGLDKSTPSDPKYYIIINQAKIVQGKIELLGQSHAKILGPPPGSGLRVP